MDCAALFAELVHHRALAVQPETFHATSVRPSSSRARRLGPARPRPGRLVGIRYGRRCAERDLGVADQLSVEGCRCPGSFAHPQADHGVERGGQVRQRSDGHGGGSSGGRRASAAWVCRSYGTIPVRHSYRTAASAYMSLRAVGPRRAPARVRCIRPCELARCRQRRTRRRREAEIGEIGGDPTTRRMFCVDVAVDHAHPMRRVEARRNLGEDPDALVGSEDRPSIASFSVRPRISCMAKKRPCSQWPNSYTLTTSGGQSRPEPGLTTEAGPVVTVAAELSLEDLQCNSAPVGQPRRAVDDPHPAVAERVTDPVASDACACSYRPHLVCIPRAGPPRAECKARCSARV